MCFYLNYFLPCRKGHSTSKSAVPKSFQEFLIRFGHKYFRHMSWYSPAAWRKKLQTAFTSKANEDEEEKQSRLEAARRRQEAERQARAEEKAREEEKKRKRSGARQSIGRLLPPFATNCQTFNHVFFPFSGGGGSAHGSTTSLQSGRSMQPRGKKIAFI